MRRISILLAIVALIGCKQSTEKSIDKVSIKNVFSDNYLKEIHDQKDFRNSVWLIQELQKQDEDYLVPILDALSSTKDSTAYSAIADLFSDDDFEIEVYNAAANALGNLCPLDSVGSLITICAGQENSIVQDNLIGAIGRTGSLEGFEHLLDHEITAGTMHGLYYSMTSGNLDIRLIDKAIEALSNDQLDVRFWSSHILLRQRDFDITEHMQEMIQAYKKEENEATRIAMAGAFRKCIGPDKTNFLLDALSTTDVVPLSVNLIRSLDNDDFPNAYKKMLTYVTNDNYQLASTAISFLKNNYNEILDEDLKLLKNDNPILNAQLLSLKAMKANSSDVVSLIKQRFNESEIDHEKTTLIGALPSSKKHVKFFDKIFLDDSNNLLQGIAHEKLLATEMPINKKALYLEKGLASDNIALICQSGFAMREDTLSGKTLEWIQLMSEKIPKLKIPLEMEGLVTLQNSIEFLQSIPESKHTPKFNHPIDWHVINQLPNRPKIEVTTTKGVITWELYLDKIPGAVSAIVQLIDSGFYSDKSFHRVVPNFVAQGGCPRGDGWGSLDFTLRSEYADGITYKTGAIGLASAGEDTESCQFFMCHSPTPHLNNRYTIIGNVIEGFDVMNNLGVGDRIIGMRRM